MNQLLIIQFLSCSFGQRASCIVIESTDPDDDVTCKINLKKNLEKLWAFFQAKNSGQFTMNFPTNFTAESKKIQPFEPPHRYVSLH